MSRYLILPKEWGYTGKRKQFLWSSMYMQSLLPLDPFPMIVPAKQPFTVYISDIYGKVVVASKVPLPNYRPDLDDRRPQREVFSFLCVFCDILSFFFLPYPFFGGTRGGF